MSRIVSVLSPTIIRGPGGSLPPDPTFLHKWTPGNYIEIGVGGSGRASQWSTPTNNNISSRGVLQRLRADPTGRWKGVMLRYSWTELEGDTQGSYNAGLDSIDSYLEQIAAEQGRKLMLFIALKTFGKNSMSVPAYMRAAANENIYGDGTNYQGSGIGQYAYGSVHGGPGGYVPNMHVNAVRDRFIALLDALATRFNNHPNFEAVVMSEAAISFPIGAPGSWTAFTNGSPYDLWYDKMGDALIAGKQAFDKTNISQWVNSPRNFMETWVPRLRSNKIGIGMTDLCKLDVGFNFRSDGPGAPPPGNIQHCQETNGICIVTGHMSAPAMDGTVVNRCQEAQTSQNIDYPAYPGVGQSRQESTSWSKNTCKISHRIWIHNTTAQPNTGDIDPNIPKDDPTTPAIEGCDQNPWTAYSNYGGQSHNKITDEFILNLANDISTQEARPAGMD